MNSIVSNLLNHADSKIKEHNNKKTLLVNICNVEQTSKKKQAILKMGQKLKSLGSKIYNAFKKNKGVKNKVSFSQEYTNSQKKLEKSLKDLTKLKKLDKNLKKNMASLNKEINTINDRAKDVKNKNINDLRSREKYTSNNQSSSGKNQQNKLNTDKKPSQPIHNPSSSIIKKSVTRIPVNMSKFFLTTKVASSGYLPIRNDINQCKTPDNFKKALAKILVSRRKNKISQEQRHILRHALAKKFSTAVKDINFVKKIDNVFVRHMLPSESYRNNAILENYEQSVNNITKELDAKIKNS